MNEQGEPAGARPRADWYPDPTGRYEYRWFNGEMWTADVSRDGVRSVDNPSASSPPMWATSPSTAAAPVRSGKATAALVLGIVALGLSWVPFLVVAGGVCAVLAIAFGIAARRAVPRDPRGFAGVGIILGAAAIVVCALGVFLTIRIVDEIDAFTNPPDHDVDITRCARDGSVVAIEGTLANTDDRASEFLVFVRVRTEAGSQATVIDVGRVAPDATESFARDVRLDRSLSDGDGPGSAGDASCAVTDVSGPYPFGVEMAP